MRILSIDAGTYSVKYLVATLERKKITIDFSEEIIVPSLTPPVPTENEQEIIDNQPYIPLDQWTEIIRSISQTDEETKVILQYPHQLITSRYLTLPNVSNKKLDMMIPFQLDESIPYSSMDSHIISSLEKDAHNVHGIVSVAQKNEFETFYNHLRSSEILPSLLTSELDLINTYVSGIKMEGPAAIIDIGHRTTKAYMIYQNRVISNHISHRAGVSIDYAIAQAYNISLEEASEYKHQNCFFLTEGQYDSVNDEQKEFANLMKETMGPLIQDIKRWTLGFRVKYGLPIENVYITGGTSQINNIDNFLTQTTGKITKHLGQIEKIDDDSQTIGANANQFYLSKIMAATQAFKERPHNFLFGNYSRAHGHSIPAHSAAFILARTSLLSIAFSVLLLAEIFLISADNKKVAKAVKRSVKSPELALTRAQQRYYPKKADKLLKALKKKKNVITQEVKTIQSASEVNAIAPLAMINKLVGKKKDVEMIYFRGDGEMNHARFLVKDAAQLKTLEKSLLALGLDNARASASPPKKTIDFHFEVMP
jgi:Tfp pilus assembly PilM family ATPase